MNLDNARLCLINAMVKIYIIGRSDFMVYIFVFKKITVSKVISHKFIVFLVFFLSKLPIQAAHRILVQQD